MEPEFRLFPEEASTLASKTDGLFLYETLVCGFFAGLVFVLIIVFVVKYRRKSEDQRATDIHTPLWLEITWIAIPFALSMVMFGWGAEIYFDQYSPPEDVLDIQVVGLQWMWKFQHPTGMREINELHVPVGRPIKLTLATQDVIHSFYVPAFRLKHDVVPGRYFSTWFQATKPGVYHLFCAEYCGTGHSMMVGRVVVLTPRQYEEWLSGGKSGETLASAGRRLFDRLGCTTCHRDDSLARAPQLEGLFGNPVVLSSGQVVTADEEYLRESILHPQAKLVRGFEPIMPSYQGQLSEEDLLKLIAYIKSIAAPRQEQDQ